MADTLYCYHCRTYHPREEMRQINTKGGKRWRCIKSIEATKRSVAEREAFGRQMTAKHRARRAFSTARPSRLAFPAVPVLEFASLVLLGALGWFWLDGLRARDAAVAAARRACESEGLQFLDDTVSFAGIKLERDDEGALRLRRVYNFEYSDTGDNRRRGSVVMLGRRVILLNVGLRAVPDQRTLH